MLLFCEYVTFDIEPPVDISSAFAACACNGVSIKREIIVQKTSTIDRIFFIIYTS